MLVGDLCGCIENRMMVLVKEVSSDICSVECLGDNNYTCGSNQFNFSSKFADHGTVFKYGDGKTV